MQENNHLLDVLTRKGVLLNVSVRYWRATKKLTAEDLGLDPESVEKRLFSLGHKNLIPRGSLQSFALIESRSHALVDACTFPFLNGLGHFLPNTRLEETMGKLAKLEQEFMAEKDVFLGRYSEMRALGLAEWREAATRLVGDPERLVEKIEESFPTPERMERSFGFTTQLFQISVPDGFSMDQISLDEQQDIIRAREQAVQEAAQRIHRGVESFVSDCVASLREQTATLCEEMLDSMKSGKTGVHQKTLNRLVKFIDEFKSLNFVGDVELEAQLNRVRQEFLTRPAEQYRDSAFYRGKLQSGLQSLADTAREMTRQDNRQLVEQFGQLGRRKLHIDAEPLAEPGFGERQDDALMMKAG
ncbi:MAG: DUF3150 domain-containing protein [bacterium]